MLYYLDVTRRSILTALSVETGGIRAVILFGPPGTGKTSLGRYFAATRNAEIVYYLCHHWTSDVELFQDIDVGQVVVGTNDSEKVYQPGVLLRAVEITRLGKECVVIIDELDKAPERVDALLLEFLQTGCVYDMKGRMHQADLNKLFVFITSNEMRYLSPPLLRRCLRVWLDHFPPHIETEILREKTKAPISLCKTIISQINKLREMGIDISLSEAERLVLCLRHFSTLEEAEPIITGWLIKDRPASDDEAQKVKEAVSAVWAEAAKTYWRKENE